MAKRKRVISHRDFVRDLERGARGEDVVERFLQEEFGVLPDNVSKKNPDFDLIIDKIDPEFEHKRNVVPKRLLKKIFKDAFGYSNKKELSVEVKFDEAAARYKNLFVEIFFDADTGSPGTTFKCKADVIAWVVPARKKFNIYLFKRPEFLAWFLNYVFENAEDLDYKTPGISPQARGIALPIEDAVESPACLGEYTYKL